MVCTVSIWRPAESAVFSYLRTFGMFLLTVEETTMVVRIVVTARDTRAGTAASFIQKQHQESITRITAGVKMEKMKNSRRRLNENTA